MTAASVFPPLPAFADADSITPSQLRAAHAAATADRAQYWMREAAALEWLRAPTVSEDVSFALEDFHIHWFADGALNVAANCLDRHLATRGDKTAIIFEPDDVTVPARRISYRELFEQVGRAANALRALGIGKGDRVTIYLPMIPEAAIAMLACARIGAVHSVVFGGFSAEALAGRIGDCQSKLVITADEGLRGGKHIALKANVDIAVAKRECACVETVLVVRHSGGATSMQSPRDRWWHEMVAGQDTIAPAECMNAEDPLFILYTSGSTGKPKGVLHTSGGYLLYAATTHRRVFDLRESDVFFCTADVGWVTGHSYVVYGPLANGATTVMFEGVPSHPDAGRFWDIVDRHKVSIFYTAPTAIRALMRDGETHVQSRSRASLRLLGTVGEPINPEAWLWYHRVVGDSRCPIVDTWWQTETGGILIAPLPAATTLKPGSATQALPGVFPAIMDANGNEVHGAGEGNLVLRHAWPGMMRTVYGDHARFIDTYFKAYPGSYFTGDGARRDADGDWWITGRVDDVINVSGHRIGTAEVESALVGHHSVAEAAVVGYPHDIKGQGIYAYVTLKSGVEASDALRAELRQHVRSDIGAIASPDLLQWAPGLPKTRSGKIMRRILRKIAANEHDALGDISTLADPGVVALLVDQRLNR
jgi:acetyl-CoA synthetase